MVRAFELKVGHFTFDDARVSTVAAGRQDMTNNIAQEPTPQAVMEERVNQLEFGNGSANEVQRLNEAEATWVEVVDQTGLVHDEAHDEMGQEQGVQFLNDPHGLEGAQGSGE